MELTSGKVEIDFVQQVGSLPQESLIRFYELLAHNLTVSVRAIWSDETLNDSQRVVKMKWLNEIMHRVVLKSAALRMDRNELSEADTWSIIEHYISVCPDIATDMSFAIIGSYQVVDRQRGAA
jgi:hypothetical protein